MVQNDKECHTTVKGWNILFPCLRECHKRIESYSAHRKWFKGLDVGIECRARISPGEIVWNYWQLLVTPYWLWIGVRGKNKDLQSQYGFPGVINSLRNSNVQDLLSLCSDYMTRLLLFTQEQLPHIHLALNEQLVQNVNLCPPSIYIQSSFSLSGFGNSFSPGVVLTRLVSVTMSVTVPT